MSNIIGNGRLRHYFHGSYFAAIGVSFSSEENADIALLYLTEYWSKSKQSPNVILTECVSSEVLHKIKDQLKLYVDDVNKVDSIKTSIDFGEPFQVVINHKSEHKTPEEQMSFSFVNNNE